MPGGGGGGGGDMACLWIDISVKFIPCRIISGDLAKRQGIIAGARWCESASACQCTTPTSLQ